MSTISEEASRLLRQVNASLDNDEDFWIEDDPEFQYEWSINPTTGEFMEIIGLKQNTNIDCSTEFPSCLRGIGEELTSLGEVELEDEIVSDVVDEEKSNHSESIEGTDTIDQLLIGVEKIKLVFSGESMSQSDKMPKAKPNVPKWAQNVDIKSVPLDYDQVVPDPPSFKHPFELDNFQKHAVYRIERNESVFVAAHTSAGKTAVAEYAIGLCQKHLTKAIYTSPIKALSNQKFRDFRDTFGAEEVGLVTGDVQINPNAASCLIMTTEILRSMLYRDSEVLRQVEWVIFDEVHYVNDSERGVVWEEVIIMLPKHVRLVLLSATTPNTFEFADWVGRTRGEMVYVITTLFRPVPLEHFLYINKELFKLVEGAHNREWREENYKAAQKKFEALKTSKQPFIGASVLVDLVYFLRKRSLLPCVVFSFSRKKCEEWADALLGLDLNESAVEHAQVHQFVSMAVSRLSPEDRDLPQLHRMAEMLKRGIAVHHSGLLPIMKECVEILFSRGLVKVLLATETFAMGINMPARTVVFSSVKKHDGTTFRLLQPGEYTQMAGRAGRRGKDTVGTVILLGGSLDGSGEMTSALTLQSMLLGQPTKLKSQFRVTFGMILGLLRFETLQVEEMLKRSFSENASQKLKPEQEEHLKRVAREMEACPDVDCPVCIGCDLQSLTELSIKIRSINAVLFKRVMNDFNSKMRYFEPGKILLIDGPLGAIPALILKVNKEKCSVMTLKQAQGTKCPLPPNHIDFAYKKCLPESLITIDVDPNEVLFLSTSKVPFSKELNGDLSDRQIVEVKQRLAGYLHSKEDSFEELDIPDFKTLELDEMRMKRDVFRAKLYAVPCPRFVEHYRQHYEKASLISRMAEIQFASSDAALALLPEYRARTSVLKRLSFIDEVSGSVLLKGRVACEVRTVENTHLLVVLELLFSGFFANLARIEFIAALMSAFYCQEKVSFSDEELFDGLPGDLVDACYHLEDTLEELVKVQRDAGIQVTVEEARVSFGLVPVVYYWSLGHPFAKIAGLTEVLEGTIVRCMVRLEEGLRELCHSSKIMGDMDLAKKFEQSAVSIKRDICFASSLYL